MEIKVTKCTNCPFMSSHENSKGNIYHKCKFDEILNFYSPLIYIDDANDDVLCEYCNNWSILYYKLAWDSNNCKCEELKNTKIITPDWCPLIKEKEIKITMNV